MRIGTEHMTAQDPIEAFRAYAATCDAIQRRIIEVDNQPERGKSLRGFGLREVCRLLERDETALRPLAAAAALFQPGGRATISQIADLRSELRAGRVNASRPPRRACVLTIANFKGGAAKSTTAVHLAQYLTLRGHRVLLVDLDSQATATAAFGFAPDADFEPSQTLWSYMRGDEDNIESLLSATHWPGLDLLPANLGLYQTEFELPARQMRSRDFNFWSLLRRGLASIEDRYDVIICDCPPSLGYLSVNAIYAATAMLVPCPPSMADFASTGRFFAMVADTMSAIAHAEGATSHRLRFIRLLITRFSPSDRNQQTLSEFLEASFPGQILKSRMAQTTALDLAGNVKRSLYELDPSTGRTLERALEYMDAVNREIEGLIVEAAGGVSARGARAA
jgi:chromosome partitioning protein